jgi:hypothetical protein
VSFFGTWNGQCNSIQNTGYRIQDTGYRIQDTEYTEYLSTSVYELKTQISFYILRALYLLLVYLHAFDYKYVVANRSQNFNGIRIIHHQSEVSETIHACYS